MAWYRTSFDLSASDASAGVTLQITTIDDDDIAWVNGAEVGKTAGYNGARSYALATSVLRAGRNVLAVRVTDGGGGGGINGAVTLRRADGSFMSLAGNWKFAVEQLSFAEDGQEINKVPSALYNWMVHPIVRFPVKGFIWYQGESNANNVAQAYRAQFTTLITSWRRAWAPSRDTLPFVWVQLPNYGMPSVTPPATSAWATQRESMDAALALQKTGRAIAIDVGETGDSHPRNKRDPGQRLARVAQRVARGAWRTVALCMTRDQRCAALARTAIRWSCNSPLRATCSSTGRVQTVLSASRLPARIASLCGRMRACVARSCSSGVRACLLPSPSATPGPIARRLSPCSTLPVSPPPPSAPIAGSRVPVARVARAVCPSTRFPGVDRHFSILEPSKCP